MQNRTENDSPSEVVISKKLVLVNSISGVVSKVISLSILVWLQQYLVHRIPAEEYSLYPVFVSIMMFLLVAKSVFTGGIARYLIGARTTNDNQKIVEITSSTFFLNLVVALVILVIGLFAASRIETIIVIDEAYITEARIMMAIIVVSFCIRLAFASFESGLVVEQRFVIINLILLGQTILQLTILLILLLGVSPRVIWVTVATEGSSLASLLFLVFYSRKLIPSMRIRLSEVRISTLNQVLKFGAWNFVGMIANRLYLFSDSLILNRLSNPFQVTIMHLGGLIPKRLFDIITHSAFSVLPSITAMYETGQYERLGRTYLRIGRVMMWVFLLVGTPLIVLRNELMGLYTHGLYTDAALILLILVIAGAFEQSYSSVSRIAFAMARMRRYSLIAITSQTINVAFTIYLVSVFQLGALGAALSTLTVRILIEFPLFSVTGVRMLNLRYIDWFTKTFLAGLIPAVITFFFMTVVKSVWSPIGWWGLFQQAALGVIVYLGGVMLASDKNDRRDIARIAVWVRERVLSAGKDKSPERTGAEEKTIED